MHVSFTLKPVDELDGGKVYGVVFDGKTLLPRCS